MYRDRIVINGRFAIAGLIGLIISFVLPFGMVIYVLAFPYIILWLAWGKVNRKIPKLLGCPGDLSYPIYLCGFPIQQTIVYLNGGSMNPYYNMLISIPIAIVTAAIVHFVIERPINNRIVRTKNAI